MAGVKGKSGGARAGAGRKRAPKPALATPEALPPTVSVELEPQAHGGALKRSHAEPVPVEGTDDMLELLQNVALGRTAATALQVRAAIAAVQYTHTKRGDGGKKEEKAAAASQAATTGRFAQKMPPRLVSSR